MAAFDQHVVAPRIIVTIVTAFFLFNTYASYFSIKLNASRMNAMRFTAAEAAAWPAINAKALLPISVVHTKGSTKPLQVYSLYTYKVGGKECTGNLYNFTSSSQTNGKASVENDAVFTKFLATYCKPQPYVKDMLGGMIQSMEYDCPAFPVFYNPKNVCMAVIAKQGKPQDETAKIADEKFFNMGLMIVSLLLSVAGMAVFVLLPDLMKERR